MGAGIWGWAMIQPWTRFVILRAATGAGFALALSLFVGGIAIYKAHPRAVKPWNTHAINASFSDIGVDSADGTLVFYYVLANETDRDYQLPDQFDVTVMSKLKEGALSLDNGSYKSDADVFLPARQRVRFAVHSAWRFPADRPGGGTLASYVNELAPSLDGFVVFDQKNRYEIELPKGWNDATAALSR